MSTKTMHPPPRRVSWASPISTSNSSGTKRNESEDGLEERPKKVSTTTKLDKPMNYNNKGSKSMDHSKKGSSYNNKGSKPMSYNNKGSSSKAKNHLLAGCMAHEYLTKGTLMGRRWDQVPSQRVEPKQEEKHQMYVELAHLLKIDGTQMNGIVNPTQLARTVGLL